MDGPSRRLALRTSLRARPAPAAHLRAIPCASYAAKTIGKPCAGNPQARFERGKVETGPREWKPHRELPMLPTLAVFFRGSRTAPAWLLTVALAGAACSSAPSSATGTGGAGGAGGSTGAAGTGSGAAGTTGVSGASGTRRERPVAGGRYRRARRELAVWPGGLAPVESPPSAEEAAARRARAAARRARRARPAARRAGGAGGAAGAGGGAGGRGRPGRLRRQDAAAAPERLRRPSLRDVHALQHPDLLRLAAG